MRRALLIGGGKSLGHGLCLAGKKHQVVCFGLLLDWIVAPGAQHANEFCGWLSAGHARPRGYRCATLAGIANFAARTGAGSIERLMLRQFNLLLWSTPAKSAPHQPVGHAPGQQQASNEAKDRPDFTAAPALRLHQMIA